MEIYLGMMRFQISSVLHEITLRSSYLSSLFVYRRILERLIPAKTNTKVYEKLLNPLCPCLIRGKLQSLLIQLNIIFVPRIHKLCIIFYNFGLNNKHFYSSFGQWRSIMCESDFLFNRPRKIVQQGERHDHGER